MLMITDFASRFPDAEDHFSDLLNDIVDAHGKKKPKLVKQRINRCLNSYDARLIAVEQAVRKMGLPVTNSDIEAIAQKLNPWAGSYEPARVSARRKGEPGAGGYRLTFDFGVENRALQYLVKAILLVLADLHPHQYGTVGTRAAIAHVAEMMRQSHVWAVELDIVKCFPSFKEEELHKFLFLPKKVIRHVVMASHLSIVSGNLYGLCGPAEDGVDPIKVTDFLAEARQGIPQGSAASSIVAEILLAPLYKALPTIGMAIGYLDNTLLMAKNQKDLVTITSALLSAQKAHPVGLLRPHVKSVSGPGDPVDYLGHRLTLINGNMKIAPNPENDAIFEGRMKKGISRLKNTKLSMLARQRHAKNLRRYLNSWTANFALCDGIADRRALWLSKIQAACDCKKQSMSS
jgi:hypothetical protein